MSYNQEYQTHKYSPFPENTCEYIMLHHTGPGKTKVILEYLANNPTKVSCHFVVSPEGEVYQLAHSKKVTRHAGKSNYDGRVEFNLYSIGIEVVSDGHKFTDAQRDAVRKLVKFLMKKYNIPPKRVIRHKEVASFRGKRDIGDNFWNTQFSSFAEWQKSLDIEEPELTPEAEEARKLGIWNGLDPDKPATREQVAMMIMRAVKLE